jgi:signal transduction histidine kinase
MDSSMPMPTRPPPKVAALTGPQPQFADAQVVGRIRLLLAFSVLLATIVEPRGDARSHACALLLLACYALTCMAVSVCAANRLPMARGRLMHWLDVAAAFVIFAIGGHLDILPFIFLVLAIVVASLRWGLHEGGRVAIASVALYLVGGLATMPDAAPPQLLLGAAVLLALGYAIAVMGERSLQATRRLALLRDLNGACNPRFGVDRSLTAALENTRAFFGAERCIVLLEELETAQYFCRSVGAGGPLTVPAEAVDAALAHALLPFPRSHILLYRCGFGRWRRLPATSLGHAGEPSRWHRFDGPRLAGMAELLEADCFISAPLVLGRGKGRIYVTSRRRHLGRADALFLAQIVAQGLRVIDRIELLDRIASDAARLARKKFALDLHDSAIQPYVGLQLGLAALRKRAEPANPLIDELDKLLAVADGVIAQLRDFARGVGFDPGTRVPLCLSALRLQSEQAMTTYGVDISIHMEGRIGFGDRLTAEVLQIVREGLSNICRHTLAKRGAVSLRCGDHLLRIEIDNENCGQPPPAFLPRSIAARAAALGGTASVRQGPLGSTVVCVEIPV